MVESRSIEVRLAYGKVGALAYVVMKVLDGDKHRGQKLSAQSLLTTSSYLQPMLSNVLIRIGSVRLNLLQSFNVKGHHTARPH